MVDGGFGNIPPQDFENMRRELDGIRRAFDSVSQSLQRTVRENKDTLDGISTSYVKTSNVLKTLSTQLADDLKALKGHKKLNQDINTLRRSLLSTENTLYQLRQQAVYASDEEKKIIWSAAQAVQTKAEHLQKALEVAQEFKKEIVRINKNLVFFDKLAEGIKSIPGLGPMIVDPFEKAAKAAKKAAEEGEGLMKIYAKGFKELFLSLGSLFTLATITKNLLEATTQAKELSVALGISQTTAFELQQELTTYANQSENAKLTTQGLVKAQLELQKQLKLGVVYSGDTLKNFIELTEYLGVSAEAASRLTLLQQSLGDTSGVYLDNLAESVVLAGKALKVNVPIAEAYETIASASAETLITLQRSPQLLAQTLVQAKKIGAEFDDLAKISSSLLDFESSIRAELEAEVLTGRQLNLEQARIASIMGNRKALAEELATQIGTITDYEQMNVIARESLAQSFGLSVEEMSKMLLRQEAINTLGENAEKMSDKQLQSARALVSETVSLGEALRQVNQEASATQEFELAAKQIQQAFQAIVVKAAPLVKKLSSFLSDFLASGLGKIVTIGAAGLSLVMKSLSLIRGATPATPMYVKDIGSGWITGGKHYKGGQFMPGGKRAPAGGKTIGRGLTTRGMMGIGGGLLGAGAMLASTQVENPYGSNMLQYGGMGATIGSFVGPIGTAVGAALGTGVGAIIGYLEDKEQREIQREQQREKEQEKFQDTLQKIAMKEAKLYMNSVEVGRTMVDSTPQQQ